MPQNVNGALAFLAGVISFLSPCVLPLIPAYLSYLSGVGLNEPGVKVAGGWRVFLHACFFVAGFSLVFIALGWSTSLVSQVFFLYRDWIRRIGGIVIVVFGLAMLGVLHIPFLEREHRFSLKTRPESYFGSLLVGVVFGAGWTPCIGPVLGSILVLASTSPGQGAYLLGLYSLGLAIPFLASVLFVQGLLRLRRFTVLIQRIGGALLVAMGILLLTGWLADISAFLLRLLQSSSQ